MRIVLFLLCVLPAMLVAAESRLPDAEQEQRAHQLFRQFRCMVCQSQSLAESDAPLAQDLRGVIREHIKKGETDAEITDYLHSRYGDYILFAPPFSLATSLLWVGPFLVLLLGAIGVVLFIRKQHNAD